MLKPGHTDTCLSSAKFAFCEILAYLKVQNHSTSIDLSCSFSKNITLIVLQEIRNLLLWCRWQKCQSEPIPKGKHTEVMVAEEDAFDSSAAICDIEARLARMNAQLADVLLAFLKASHQAQKKSVPRVKAGQKRRREDDSAEN